MAKQSAFQIFNQKLKEKIGVAEQVTTYPEEPELSNKLEILTNQVKKITRELHKQEKTTTTLLEAGNEISDSLVDGGVSFREDPLRFMLAGSLDKVAEVQRHVDDLRSKLGKQIISEVYEPLDNVVEVDVKEAKLQKSKFEKTRVELDTGISKLTGLGKKAKEEKIKEVEMEVEELRKHFTEVGVETVDKLQDTIALSEAELLGSLVHYMELYRDFFSNSNRFLISLIPEIEEYKNYIEAQKELLHGSAIAKQIEAAAAAIPPEKKFGTLKLKSLKSSFGISDKKKVDKNGTAASEVNIAKAENDPFGKDIEAVANKDGTDIPVIVEKAVDYIENKGLQEEGVFRISASKKEVDQLKNEIAQTADTEKAAEKQLEEDMSSTSTSESYRSEETEVKEKDKDSKVQIRQRSAGSLMTKKTSLEDLRQARRLERAHTISIGIAEPAPESPKHKKPKKGEKSEKSEKSVEKSVEEPHAEGSKKKHTPTSPRFKNFMKKLSFRAEKKDKVEKKDDKSEEPSSKAEKVENEDKDKKPEKKEKKTDEKKLDKEKKDEEKRLEKERKELEKKKKKETDAAEKEAKKLTEKKDKKKKDESASIEVKTDEVKVPSSPKSKGKKDKAKDSSPSSSDSVVKYDYKPVEPHHAEHTTTVEVTPTESQAPIESEVTAAVVVAVPSTEGATSEPKPVEEKAPEVKTHSRSSSTSSSSSKSAEAAKEPEQVTAPEATQQAEGHVLENKVEVVAEVPKEPEAPKSVEPEHGAKEPEAAKEPEHTPKEAELVVKEPEHAPKVHKPAVDVKDKEAEEARLAKEHEEKEAKKKEKEEKARKEKEESAKKKAEKEAEKEAKKKEKEEKEQKEREEKERKKAEKESKKKPEKEKVEKEKKKADKKPEEKKMELDVEAVAAKGDKDESSSSEAEKKKVKSPKWLKKLKPKTGKKDDGDKSSPREAGDLVRNNKKKVVTAEAETDDLESSINSPRVHINEPVSDSAAPPSSNASSEVKIKLESTEKSRAETQTHIEEQTRTVLTSVGSKLDELETELNTLDLSISPRESTVLAAEPSPREEGKPDGEKLNSELQNLEEMLNNMPAQNEPVAPVTASVDTTVADDAKEKKDQESSSSSSSSTAH